MSDLEAALDAARKRGLGGSSHEANHSSTSPPNSSSGNTTTVQQDSLPIIDISSFLDPSATQEARQRTAKAINAACIDYGFFYLTGHNIPVSQLDEVISLARSFFALPLEEKNKVKRFDAGGPEGGDGARGYQGLGENVTGGLKDMQEAIDWYAAWPAEKKEAGDGGPGSVKTLQGDNLWPERPEKLKAVYEEYVERVKKVGEAVVHAMGVALDLGPAREGIQDNSAEDEEIFKRACADSFWVIRMIGYPPLTTPHTPGTDISTFSCGAHTDYGCVTLLLSDPTPGALQVQLKNGTWLPADPLPGAFVVNIGDMIERWTNGLWRSTLHRVIHRGQAYRISVPFFFEPAFEADVRPLRRCVRGREERRGIKGEAMGIICSPRFLAIFTTVSGRIGEGTIYTTNYELLPVILNIAKPDLKPSRVLM